MLPRLVSFYSPVTALSHNVLNIFLNTNIIFLYTAMINVLQTKTITFQHVFNLKLLTHYVTA